jgi:hypothetical protein
MSSKVFAHYHVPALLLGFVKLLFDEVCDEFFLFVLFEGLLNNLWVKKSYLLSLLVDFFRHILDLH